MFFCEFCEIVKNISFLNNPWSTTKKSKTMFWKIILMLLFFGFAARHEWIMSTELFYKKDVPKNFKKIPVSESIFDKIGGLSPNTSERVLRFSINFYPWNDF